MIVLGLPVRHTKEGNTRRVFAQSARLDAFRRWFRNGRCRVQELVLPFHSHSLVNIFMSYIMPGLQGIG